MKTRTSWVLLALIVTAPLSPRGAAAVLCIGADGHVHAETADGLRCDRSAMPVDDSQHFAHSDNEDCRDIPLPSKGEDDQASFLQGASQSAKVTLEFAGIVPPDAFSAEGHLPVNGDRFPQIRNASIPLIKTYVLLI